MHIAASSELRSHQPGCSHLILTPQARVTLEAFAHQKAGVGLPGPDPIGSGQNANVYTQSTYLFSLGQAERPANVW